MTKPTDNTAKPIDLASLDTGKASDEGARIELQHPTTGTGLGVFVTVLGKHSQVFRDIVRDRVNRRVRDDANAQRRGKTAELMTAEQAEREAVELLVACTIGWDSGEGKPTFTFKKEELAFTVANAITVYSELIWVREQIDDAIGDLENFIKA